MRKPPRPAPNPGFQEPRAYLAGGFHAADGKTIKPALLTDVAAAMGRELLIRAVPLGLLKSALEALMAVGAAPPPQQPAGLKAWAAQHAHARHPLLAQLVTEGARRCRGPADLHALTAHMRRVFVLANFERTLGRANAASLARSERASKVRASRQRRGAR